MCGCCIQVSALASVGAVPNSKNVGTRIMVIPIDNARECPHSTRNLASIPSRFEGQSQDKNQREPPAADSWTAPVRRVCYAHLDVTAPCEQHAYVRYRYHSSLCGHIDSSGPFVRAKD